MPSRPSLSLGKRDHLNFLRSTLLCSILILAVSFLTEAKSHGAVPIYWDTVANDGQLTPGNGTWSTSNSYWSIDSAGSPTLSPWINGSQAQFEGGDAPIGQTWNVTATSGLSASNILFNSSGYVLSASSATSISAPSLAVATGKTATIGANVSITGSSSMALGAGNYGGSLVIENGGTVTTTGNSNFSIRAGDGLSVQVKTGANLTAGSSIVLSNSGDAAAATLTVDGGTVTTGGGSSSNATLILGNAVGSTAVVNLNSGVINLNGGSGGTSSQVRFGPSGAPVTAGTITGTFNLNGGTLTTSQILEGPQTVGGGVVNSTFNFNGGTLQATTGTMLGGTFMTGLDRVNVRNGGALIDTTNKAVTIAQALLHSNIGGDSAIDGGLTKKGINALTLNGANAYTGHTKIEAGTLTINTAYLYDQSDVLISSGATFNLNFSGIDTINALYFNGIAQAVGTWGAVGNLGVDFTSSLITGSGVLQVSAIPEPGTLGTLILGFAGCLLLHRVRRRNQNN